MRWSRNRRRARNRLSDPRRGATGRRKPDRRRRCDPAALPRDPRAASRLRRFCHRLLQRPRPVLGPRGDRQAGARHRRMRNYDGTHPRSPVWRDLDPGALGAPPPALHRRHGPGAAPRRRLAGRPRCRQLGDVRTALTRMIDVGRSLRDEPAPTFWSWAAPGWRAPAPISKRPSASR